MSEGNLNIRALYISYDGMTDPLGQSQVIPYLEGLSKHGISFTLISFEKPDKFEKLKGVISEKLALSSIAWVPLPYTKKPPVLSTVWDVMKLFRTASNLHAHEKFDVVHCRSYISSLAGLSMKKKFGTKFIFDMRGFWADERVEGKLWNLSNPIYKMIYNFFKKKELRFLNEADAVVSLTENGKQSILEWKGIKNNLHMDIIPCCVDMNLFSEKKVDVQKLNVLKAELNSDLIISYVGSIGTWYMLGEMLDFFSSLLKKKPNVKFLFVTPEKPEYILEAAAEKKISADRFLIRFAQRSEMPTYLAASDYSLFFIQPTFSKKSSSPTKHGEIMSMGIPVICNAGIGDMDSIISKTASGILIENFTEADYSKAVTLIETTSFSKEKIRSSCKEIYSLNVGVEKYFEVYQRITAH